ncbi:MAG: hypothetical protein BM556_03310 [Bacteriovorax sp. MedPE-SWde]|nr:MAG: hypothetical protein BM556_03310 [Bacteriovorax sp. MedPE-SWde]
MLYRTLIIFLLCLPANSRNLQAINNEYIRSIKPLIKENCLSCHGGFQLDTWYRDLPLIKMYINGHITDAKESLNMENDIPFKGRGIQSDIFWSIIASIKKERMPPQPFSLVHGDIKLSPKDRDTIIKWFSEKRRVLLEQDL